MQRMAIEELDVFFDQQLFCGFVRRERQHGLLFFHPTIVRAAVDSLMYPLIGYFVEPTPAFTVCCLNIRCNPGGSESGHQRDVEALTGIPHHALHFTFGLCAERATQAWRKAHFFSELPQ